MFEISATIIWGERKLYKKKKTIYIGVSFMAQNPLAQDSMAKDFDSQIPCFEQL